MSLVTHGESGVDVNCVTSSSPSLVSSLAVVPGVYLLFVWHKMVKPNLKATPHRYHHTAVLKGSDLIPS